MPKKLDEMKKSIWDSIRGKTNPRTKKPYTESDAWAIATARWKKSGKSLSVGIDEDFELESELMINAIKDMEENK